MASKIPPHLARELRRHVFKPKPSSTSTSTNTSSNASSSSSSSGSKVLLGCLALTGTMALAPYLIHRSLQSEEDDALSSLQNNHNKNKTSTTSSTSSTSLNERDAPLTPMQIRRGAFNNSGSKDVGKDPYWDFRRGRRKRLGDVGEDGEVVTDDGGYEELFRRDDPREVDLGEGYGMDRRIR